MRLLVNVDTDLSLFFFPSGFWELLIVYITITVLRVKSCYLIPFPLKHSILFSMSFYIFSKRLRFFVPFHVLLAFIFFFLFSFFFLIVRIHNSLSSSREAHSSGIIGEYDIVSSKRTSYWRWRANYLRLSILLLILKSRIESRGVSVLINAYSVRAASKGMIDWVRTRSGEQIHTCTQKRTHT